MEQQLVITPITSFMEYVPLALRTKSPGRMAPVVDTDGNRTALEGHTEAKPKWLMECVESGPYIDLEHFTLGFESELGEAVGALKSGFFYGKDFDFTNFGEEVGDLWWYAAIGIDTIREIRGDNGLAIDMEDVFNSESIAIFIEGLDHVTSVKSLRALKSTCSSLTAQIVTYGYDSQDESLAELTESLSEYVTSAALGLVELTYQFLMLKTGSRDHDLLRAEFQMLLGRNIAKLRKRYPDKFDSAAAINREALGEERRILEAGV